MTLQEILKANGVSDEQLTAIQAAMKENKVYTASEENLDIRYGKLKLDHENLVRQQGEAQKLIADLKKGGEDTQAMQGKITAYEGTIQQLNEQLKATQVNAAVQLALVEAKATDVPYMAFKLAEKGDKLTLDEQGRIKGIDDLIAGLKTQYPDHFAAAGTDKQVQPQKLPNNDPASDNGNVTKEEFDKMGYGARVKLKQSNPELYEQFTK